jgi:pSer/pThr/pTyr-binding forkhead associated (FHA) protein
VSRQHCELFELNGQLMVRDLGSLNGTFVNNQRITESPLAPNELLTVGTVTFRAVYELEGAEKKDPTLKGTGDKTLPVGKANTIRTAPKEAKPTPAETPGSDEDFQFDKPLWADEEAPVAKSAGAATERIDAALVDKKTEAAKSGAKPPASKNSPDKKQAAKKPNDETAYAAKRKKEEEEEDKPSSSTDDDLNDFLESLGEK